MADEIKLQEPIVAGSLRATNFFNGRLVTGADLGREQAARRDAANRVGQAAGAGVVEGLEVREDAAAGKDPLVKVEKGLAVNRCGQALYLAKSVTLDLLERTGAAAAPSKIFGACRPVEVGTYAAGYGLYLLVIAPAEASEGSAPASGLNNAFATCNTDVILETVQFRLLAVDPWLKNEKLPAAPLVRNYLAYRCFGVERSRAFFKDPFNTALDAYGLLDEMKTLAETDVPLALLNWTSGGLQFVDCWSVRRRLTRRFDPAGWTQLVGDRRASETEAQMEQFAAQLDRLLLEAKNPAELRAVDHFRYLPPAGLVPLADAARRGLDAARFFGARGAKNIVRTDGDRLRALLREALGHEPIDLAASEKIRLYSIRENAQAAEKGENVRPALVFARHSLPDIGVARFDEATGDADDRFAEAIR